MQMRNALYLAGNKLDASELRREADARTKAGFETLILNRKDLKKRFGIRAARRCSAMTISPPIRAR